MVTNATSLGRSGLFDWLVQRASSLVLLAYAVWLLGGLWSVAELDYAQWRALFDAPGMRMFSIIALLSLCAHAWVGVWTVITDYLADSRLGRAGLLVRLPVQGVCALLTLVYFLWGVRIFWGG